MKVVLRIRFTNSLSATDHISDLDIPVSLRIDSDDVNKLVNSKWIKQQIRQKPICNNKRLILIYNGRVLNDNTDFKSEILVPRLKNDQDEPVIIYINCMIGEELSQQQLNDESSLDNRPQQVSTTPQVMGFDRLLQQGFSQEDVDDLRRQFHSIYNISSIDNRQDIDDLEEQESRRRLVQLMEERWIESTVNNQESINDTITQPDINSNLQRQPAPDIDDSNGNRDLLIGLLVGIFLGILSLIFLSVDDSIFSKRQKMAIFMGAFLNLSYAIMRGKWL